MGERPVVAVRVDEDTLLRLDALAERIPGTTRSSLAREAIERGLVVLEREYPPKRRKKRGTR